MDQARWQRIKRIFEAAKSQEPAARAGFLSRECGDDSELRAEVDSLLAADDQTDNFLDPTTNLSDAHAGAGPGPTRSQPPAPSDPPRFIGDYRIIRILGEGGMGVVYEAEQADPRRPVALKIIRGGVHMGSQAVRMFEREAAALARLKHPSIAPIYEVGHTEDGQPFFAMELVRGVTLTEFLADRPPAAGRIGELRFRLELFRKICDAIHYAHQRGVIHRDLKPTNVMVVRGRVAADSDPAKQTIPDIKVLDFGMARITDPEGSAATLVTDVGRIQGTLAYMSPEQARGNPDEIDLRSDVYALGILLYEIVTGRRPYEPEHAALTEAVRIICEQAPRSMSESIGSSKRCDRDLETIARKALEKDPARRYQSITTLAGDVARYLSGQPILARPPSAIYQLRKMIGRHRLGFAFTATVAAFVLVMAVTMTVQARRMQQQRNAERAARLAEKSTADFMIDLFNSSDPEVVRGKELSAREILDRGVRIIREEFEGEPAVKARLLMTMGRVYRQLGRHDEARPLLEASIRQREELGDQLGAAASRFELAWLLADAGELAAAEELYRQVLETRQRLAPHGEREIRDARSNLAKVLLDQGKDDEARELYETVIHDAGAAGGQETEQLANAYNNLGALHERHGRPKQALASYQRALSIREKLLGPDSGYVASALNNIAAIHRQQGQYDLAEREYRRSLEIRRKLHADDHPRIAIVLNNLGELERHRGNQTQATRYFRQALEIYEARYGRDHFIVGIITLNTAHVALAQGDPIKAELLARRSLQIAEKTERHDEIAGARACLATALRDQGRLEEAEPAYRAAIDLIERAYGADHPDLADILDDYAELFRRSGRGAEAAQAQRRASAIREIALDR